MEFLNQLMMNGDEVANYLQELGELFNNNFIEWLTDFMFFGDLIIYSAFLYSCVCDHNQRLALGIDEMSPLWTSLLMMMFWATLSYFLVRRLFRWFFW